MVVLLTVSQVRERKTKCCLGAWKNLGWLAKNWRVSRLCTAACKTRRRRCARNDGVAWLLSCFRDQRAGEMKEREGEEEPERLKREEGWSFETQRRAQVEICILCRPFLVVASNLRGGVLWPVHSCPISGQDVRPTLSLPNQPFLTLFTLFRTTTRCNPETFHHKNPRSRISTDRKKQLRRLEVQNHPISPTRRTLGCCSRRKLWTRPRVQE